VWQTKWGGWPKGGWGDSVPKKKEYESGPWGNQNHDGEKAKGKVNLNKKNDVRVLAWVAQPKGPGKDQN